MNVDLKSGFRLGDHRVHPLEGKVDGEGGDRHIQPKAMEVLLVLAARPGQVVSRQALLDTVWKGMVVGDEVLTRCIHELRHAFADDAVDSQIIATIPKRGYQLLLSPEPLAPVRPKTGLKIAGWTGVTGYLRVAIIAVLVVAVAVAGNRFLNAPAPGPVRIAVMRFCNIGDDPGNVYYSDGIASDVLDFLAVHPDALVSARTSSFQFECKDASGTDIPAVLGVDYVVEGSVRRDDTDLYISASLVDTDGFTVWSESYARGEDDVFRLTGGIAQSILQELGVDVSAATRSAWQARLPARLESYDYYKLGQQYLWTRTPANIERAIELFDAAIREDETFALAYTGIADAWALLAVYGDISWADAANRMQVPVDTALKLDPNLPEAYTSRGSMLELRGDYDGAADAYRAAIDRGPSFALAHMWLGHVLMQQNKVGEALDHFKRAYALDRLNVAAGSNVAQALAAGGRGPEAMATFARLREEFPNEKAGFIGTAIWGGAYGEYDAAYEAAHHVVDMVPEDPISNALLGRTGISSGHLDEGIRRLERALKLAPRNWVVIDWYADGLFVLGRHAELHRFLERQLEWADAQAIDLVGRERRILDLRAGQARLLVGDTAGAVEKLDAGYAEEGRVPLDASDELMFLGYRALAHRRAGDNATAKRILDEALDYAAQAERNGVAVPTFGVRLSGVLALAGQSDASIAQLEQAHAQGFREYRILTRDPTWDTVRDMPEFNRLAGEMEAAETAH